MSHPSPPSSLQARLLWAVALLMCATWGLMMAVTWLDVRHELDELLDGHLAQAAALLVVQQVHELEEGPSAAEDDGLPDAGRDAPSLHRYAPKAAFQVWHEGKLVLRSDSAPLTPMGPGDRHYASGFVTLQHQGESWRVFTTQGHEQDVRVYVGERIDARQSIAKAVLRSGLLPFALALPLLLVGLWWAIRHALKPLRHLDAELSARRPDALVPIELGPHVPSELQSVLSALNALFGRIATLVDNERRFTADAAHELRTPIAALRTQAQVALGAADEPARQQALRNTVLACDRASHLVTQLLTLSRLEAAAPSSLAKVSVVAVAQQVLAQQAPAALDRQQQLSLQCHPEDRPPTDPAWQIQAEPALLEMLLRNLVDNACRYSPDGADIRVTLSAQTLPQPSLRCVVADSGPGLTDADLARLGERFFRVLGQDQPGSGLGWSIVRRIAQHLQIQIRAGRSAELGGLEVVLEMTAPAHPAQVGE